MIKKSGIESFRKVVVEVDDDVYSDIGKSMSICSDGTSDGVRDYKYDSHVKENPIFERPIATFDAFDHCFVTGENV